jgi:hypothetical protein
MQYFLATPGTLQQKQYRLSIGIFGLGPLCTLFGKRGLLASQASIFWHFYNTKHDACAVKSVKFNVNLFL